MANRLILGPNHGFKISRPGFDVLTTGEDGLMFNGTNPLLQIVAKGYAVTPPGGTQQWTYVNVAIPDQGFLPLPILIPGTSVSFEFLSTSVLRLGAYVIFGTGVQTEIRYLITNQRFG